MTGCRFGAYFLILIGMISAVLYQESVFGKTSETTASDTRTGKERSSFIRLAETTNDPDRFLAAIVQNGNFYPYSPSYPYPTGSYGPAYPVYYSDFSLKNNLSTEWKLMRHGRIVFSGRGSLNNYSVPSGSNYYLVAQTVPGYTLFKRPEGLFAMPPGRQVQVALYYEKDTGNIVIKGPWPSGTPFRFMLYDKGHPETPYSGQIEPEEGWVIWKSGGLPVGEYFVVYDLPSGEKSSPQPLEVIKNRDTLLVPKSPSGGSIDVASNSSQALFTLTDGRGRVVGEGKGLRYTFRNLESGYYTLSFSVTDDQVFLPPPSQKVLVTQSKTVPVHATYAKLGRLVAGSNVEHFTVFVQPEDPNTKPFRKIVKGRSQTFSLPEGRYKISFDPLSPDMPPLGPVDVQIDMFSTRNVYLPYDLKNSSSAQNLQTTDREKTQKKPGLFLSSNLPVTGITVEIDSKTTKPLETNTFKDKSIYVPLKESGDYKIVFDAAPGYNTPDPVSVPFHAGDEKIIRVVYMPKDVFLFVPAGIAIVGDPFTDNRKNARSSQKVKVEAFEIAAYEVTNEQFANWLTKAFKEKTVSWNPFIPGHIVDKEGRLICRTLKGSPLSQIIEQNNSDDVIFSSLPGKENYPVIQVSWLGADAYCKEYGYRLPTENEWEKAAGMAIASGNESPERYIFGFSRNTVDRTWANYKDSDFSTDSGRVRTTPVGFYNGMNTLPLTIRDRSLAMTRNARSPVGAYDMSGNVWEWTSSEMDEKGKGSMKIAKGGCYDSLAEGIRVFERLLLPSDHADIYTGFRAAKSLDRMPDSSY